MFGVPLRNASRISNALRIMFFFLGCSVGLGSLSLLALGMAKFFNHPF
jgi:hypothetical protein